MNRIAPFAAAGSSQVDLAFEADFTLGGAVVRPSCREVLINRHREALEPRVMQVLVILGRAAGQTITRDELIDRCWGGRFVSDDAINRTISKIRALARLDSGASFRIETLPRLGYRLFVVDSPAAVKSHGRKTGQFSEAALFERLADRAQQPLIAPAKPSIAVLPLRLIGGDGAYAVVAEALPHDLIAELSRLHWLFVIARGSSFRFRGADLDVRQVGEALGVRYCLSGGLEVAGGRITVTVELSDALSCEVVWADRYSTLAGGVHEIRAEILSAIIAALEIQIPLHEASCARLKAPEHLDAWSAYHLGLEHMFRFSAADNEAAITMFELAIAKDPRFARAHAGLSFTHFQNAFMHYRGEDKAEATSARRFAERAVELDALDPFVNFVVGRCFWLEGEVEKSLGWLERATALSPNYAQGIYAQSWAHMVLCNGNEARCRADDAIALSPLDPLHFAMLGTRAVSHLLAGEVTKAAHWGERAARAPGAHALISVVALVCHAANGDSERAAAWATDARMRMPNLTQRDFFRSFPFRETSVRSLIAEHLTTFGI